MTVNQMIAKLELWGPLINRHRLHSFDFGTDAFDDGAKWQEHLKTATPGIVVPEVLAPSHLTINISADAKVVINRHTNPAPKIKKNKKPTNLKVALAGVSVPQFREIKAEFPGLDIVRIDYKESPPELRQKTSGRRIYVYATCMNDEVKQIINDNAKSVHRAFTMRFIIDYIRHQLNKD